MLWKLGRGVWNGRRGYLGRSIYAEVMAFIAKGKSRNTFRKRRMKLSFISFTVSVSLFWPESENLFLHAVFLAIGPSGRHHRKSSKSTIFIPAE